jgi:hypothetical protein
VCAPFFPPPLFSSNERRKSFRSLLDTFGYSQPNHHAGAQKPADFQPGVVGRYGGEGEVMGINSQLSLRLDDGQQNPSWPGIHLLDLHALVLHQAFKHRNRQIQLTAQVGTKEGQNTLNLFRIAGVHTAGILTLSRQESEIRLK